MKRILLVFVVASCSNCLRQECSKIDKFGTTISVSSHRNETGHWTPKVHLRHERPIDETDTTGLWKLDVDQDVVKCGRSEIVNVYVKLTPPPALETKYELYPGIGYYKLHTQSVSWEEARETCESEGAHLAIINSDDEAAALRGLIDKFPDTGDWIYIGFHDKQTEGKFVTVLGEPLRESGYYAWAENEPNSLGGNEDCGTISRQALLNDIVCTQPWNFICERELE